MRAVAGRRRGAGLPPRRGRHAGSGLLNGSAGDRRDALRQQVELAFADRPYPGDDLIADSDERYPDYEGHVVTAFHRGRSWRDISLRGLREDYPADPTACLAFMRPEGWRYYLPAYLLIALDWDEADAIGDAVVGALTHPSSLKDSYARVAADLGKELDEVLEVQTARFDERRSGLSDAEIEAVREVLAYLAEHVDADNARFEGSLPNSPRVALESWGRG